MINLLFALSLSDNIYNILPPIYLTNRSEFKHWSAVGVVTNLRSSIHFASDFKRQNSGLFQRIPISSSNFEIEMKASVNEGSFNFVISSDFNPSLLILNNNDYWKNVTTLNITKINDDGILNLYHSSDKSYKLCDVVAKGNLTIKVIVNNSIVKYMVKGDKSDFEKCGEGMKLMLPKEKYISFVSQGFQYVGDSELFYLLLQQNDNNTIIDIDRIDEINRQKIIKKDMKSKINNTALPLATKIINEMGEAAYKLNALKYQYETQYIKKLILEIRERLKSSLSTKDLKNIIHATLVINLLRAEHKMKKRSQSFISIKEDLINLKESVNNKMKTISEYTIETFQKSKNESINALMNFYNMTKDYNGLTDEAKRKSNEMKSTFLPTFLYLLSLIELSCYVAFFIVKRKRTKKFKKCD